AAAMRPGQRRRVVSVVRAIVSRLLPAVPDPAGKIAGQDSKRSPYIGETRVRGSRHDHQVDPRGQLVLAQAKGLTDQPFEPVTVTRPADLLPRYGDSQARMVAPVRDSIDRENRIGLPPPPIEGASEDLGVLESLMRTELRHAD